MPGVALPDYEHARLIVIWGCNPSASGIHLVPPIQRARQRGARLVVVDPRTTRLARQADLHLALRPGTDLPVALALIPWLFESGRADLTFLAAHASGADDAAGPRRGLDVRARRRRGGRRRRRSRGVRAASTPTPAPR